MKQELYVQKEADKKEKYYIQKYNALDSNYGYNLIEGGNSLSKYWASEQHRKEQSERKKQYFKDNPDKSQENIERLITISRETANIRAEKMKENYQNEGGFFKINQERKKVIKCIETDEIFSSLTEASKKYNISIGNISSVIHGKRKTAGGYHWEQI